MTIPSNVEDANSLRFRQNDREGQTAIRYYDSEMKEGEIGSRQFVTLVDVIAEGEIAGFPSAIAAGHTQGTNDYNTTSLKDVFLNNTQVLKQSAPNTDPDDSDFNFGTADSNRPRFIPRFGTSSQTKIPGLKETERDRTVGVTVTVASPQTVTITDTSTEGIRVTIGFPRLQKIEDDGNISGTTVQYTIEVKNQANTLLKKINTSSNLTGLDRDIHTGGGTVTGKSTSPYFKDHIIFLPDNIQSSDFPVTVTVTRVTADSTDNLLQNSFEL
jgi:predicted phage tail protein